MGILCIRMIGFKGRENNFIGANALNLYDIVICLVRWSSCAVGTGLALAQNGGPTRRLGQDYCTYRNGYIALTVCGHEQRTGAALAWRDANPVRG
jgi:hypothetical protein